MIFVILSPMSGMLVEITLAWAYGTSGLVDAYRIGQQIILTISQIFFISVVPVALVPVIGKINEQRGGAAAWNATLAFSLRALGMGILVALLIVSFSETITNIVSPGLQADSKEYVNMFVICTAVALVIYPVIGAFNSFLVIQHKVWVQSLSQVSSNIILIFIILVSVWLQYTRGLVIAVVFGIFSVGVLVAAITANTLKGLNVSSFKACDSNFHSEWKMFFVLLAPVFGAMLASQSWNYILLRELSFTGPGSIALYGYAFKLLVMVSFTGMSISAVIYPKMVEGANSRNEMLSTDLLVKAIKMVLFCGSIGAVILAAVSLPAIKLIFNYGEMTESNLESIRNILLLLLLLTPVGVVTDVLNKHCYSLGKVGWVLSYQFVQSVIIIVLLTLIVKNKTLIDAVKIVVYTHVVCFCVWSTYLLSKYNLFRMYYVAIFKNIIICIAVYVSIKWMVDVLVIVSGNSLHAIALIIVPVITGVVIAYLINSLVRLEEVNIITGYLKWLIRQYINRK